MIHMDSD